MVKKTDTKINKKSSEKEVKMAAKAVEKKLKDAKKNTSKSISDKKDSERLNSKKAVKATKNKSKESSNKKIKSNKSSRSKHLERSEFVFNFLSLVMLIGICLYFGGRSLYYYSRQNIIIKEEAQTLNGYIINNDQNIVQGDADGLHHDTDGYFFKGNVDNNYVWFGNRLFRVIRVYNDNSVKLISEDLVSSFMYGESSSYRSSNVRKWLTKIKNPVSGVYYDTIPNIEHFLDKTNYSEDVMKGDKVEPSKSYSSDYVSTLTIADDPYVIEQGENKNHVDGYVKLGNDTWKVFYDKNGVLKLYLYGYINDNGNELFYNYGKKNSYFDVNDRSSVAYYLNNNYLSNLSYRDIMLDIDFYTGEISDDAGYNYYNIYNSYVSCKVGLLNVFDYVSNNAFDDYFHGNYLSNVGSMQYVSHSNGLLTESSTSDAKHIVPVIGIKADLIKGGDGSINNPYVVE